MRSYEEDLRRFIFGEIHAEEFRKWHGPMPDEIEQEEEEGEERT